MPDERTEEAVAISTGVVGALRAAGALRFEEVTTSTPAESPPPPPPPPPRAVGDRLSLFPIRAVAKNVEAGVTQFVLTHQSGDYYLDFPPDDASYVPDLDRLLTALLTSTEAFG
jgi:hypothetical protein